MNCPICNQTMADADSCDLDRQIERDDGTTRAPIPYGAESKWEGTGVEPPAGNEQCHDCGVEAGGYHHPGCDMAECPFCGGQYLACGCRTNEDEYRLAAQDWFDPDDPVGSLHRAQGADDD